MARHAPGLGISARWNRAERVSRAPYTSGRTGGGVKVERVLKKVEGGGSGACFSFEIAADGARFSFSRGPDGKVVQTLAEVAGACRPSAGRCELKLRTKSKF